MRRAGLSLTCVTFPFPMSSSVNADFSTTGRMESVLCKQDLKNIIINSKIYYVRMCMDITKHCTKWYEFHNIMVPNLSFSTSGGSFILLVSIQVSWWCDSDDSFPSYHGYPNNTTSEGVPLAICGECLACLPILQPVLVLPWRWWPIVHGVNSFCTKDFNKEAGLTVLSIF